MKRLSPSTSTSPSNGMMVVFNNNGNQIDEMIEEEDELEQNEEVDSE
jgi:2-succinyl-5-enolpyruvyl-6-hydroxy-3-cyclohexene-1-carboxylate synthase